MILQYSPWLIPFVLAAVITGTLAFISWQHRDRLISKIFMILAAALTIWAAGAAIGTIAADLPTVCIVNALVTPAIVIIPVVLLLMVFCYTGQDNLVVPRVILPLLVVPACTAILVATDPLHHGFYTGAVPHMADGAVTWQFLYGPLFWAALAYGYAILGAALVLLVRQIAAARDRYRWNLILFLVALCIPLVLTVAFTSGISPVSPYRSLTPAGFALACLIIAPGVFRFPSFSLIPVSYPLIFTAMKDGVVVIDTGGRITGLNPAAGQIIDPVPREIHGKPVRDIFPFISPLLEAGDSAGRETTAEIRTGTGDGEKFFDAYYRPIRSDEGVLKGGLILLRDITDRRQTENAARESGRRYRELVDLLPEIVFECDLDGNLTYVNDNGLAFFGYTRTDLEHGLNILSHIAEGDRQRVREDIARVIDTGKSRGNEYTATRKDGTPFPIFVVTTPVLQGTFARGLRGILIDITERRKSELAIKAAMKKLTILNSITRHDIINKLTALGAYLSLTKESTSDPAAAGYLADCEQIVRSINEHVEFMKDYQEIGINAPLWQDLNEVIRKVTGSCPNTGITVALPEENLVIFADPLFEKVIYNLLDNAIRHGERVTQVSFAARKTDAGLSIIYEDNGAGISYGDKKHLFEKGYGKNTGLGLFLSREILGITGITITETGTPGEGARFEMAIPSGGYRQKNNP